MVHDWNRVPALSMRMRAHQGVRNSGYSHWIQSAVFAHCCRRPTIISNFLSALIVGADPYYKATSGAAQTYWLRFGDGGTRETLLSALSRLVVAALIRCLRPAGLRQGPS